jgi:hypothetical protein
LEANREKSDAVAEHRELPKVEAAEEIETESEQQEVPEEEDAVETIRALEDRYRERHLIVGRRRQPWKRTQSDGGSRQSLPLPEDG